VTSIFLNGCVVPDGPAPLSEPTQVEKTGCRKLAEVFPTWAYDGDPETVANRVDTEDSVRIGVVFTAAFEKVCPGALDLWSSS
jgi:hypothetical protein